MNGNFKATAMIHSLGAKAECTIISHVNNNDVIAEYRGTRCRAIFNPFAGCYYVDDIYGVMDQEVNK